MGREVRKGGGRGRERGGREGENYFFPFPVAFNEANEEAQKDWVFQNYTFKRFEGLTQRGHLRM